MLSISKMAAGQENYYLKLAQADYYLKGGEPPGRWLGGALKALKLRENGIVVGPALRHLLSGRTPDGRQEVRQIATYADRKPQVGWDLTFSAPKSVSILWALATKEQQKAIEESHFQAVKSALGYLEEKAAFSRRGEGGSEKNRAKLVFATFEHQTSRAQQPQLHAHSLMMNAGLRPDGTWGSIDSRDIYQYMMTAGALYRAELSHQLHQQHGVPLRSEKTFGFEVKGIPAKVIEHFSARRRAIIEKAAELGWSGARAFEKLCLSTRERKGHVARDELSRQWQDEALQHGLSREKAQALMPGPKRALKKSIQQVIHDAVHASGIKKGQRRGVGRSQSQFCAQDIIRRTAESVAHRGISARQIIETVEQYLDESPTIVKLGKQRHIEHFTTAENLRLEEKMLKHVAKMAEDKKSHQVTSEIVDRTAKFYGLHKPNKSAFEYLLKNSSRVCALSGLAGTGKTKTLEAAVDAFRQAGYHVEAASRTPIAQFGEMPIDAISLLRFRLDPSLAHQWKHQLRQLLKAAFKKTTMGYKPLKLTKKSVIIIDDASSVSTEEMALIAEKAEKAGAKLILAGNEDLELRNLGGAFKRIKKDINSRDLKQVHRQIDEWLREALKYAARGDMRAVLNQFLIHKRLSIAETRKKAIKKLIKDWDKKRTRIVDETLIIAGEDKDVDKLNEMAQAIRKKKKEVYGKGVKVKGTRFCLGDRVVFTKNDRSRGIMAGDFGTITQIKTGVLSEPVMTVKLERQNRHTYTLFGEMVTPWFGSKKEVTKWSSFVLVTPKAAKNNMKLGYAVSPWSAQHTEVDKTFILAGGWMQNREASYMQLSRASDNCSLYSDEATAGNDAWELALSMQRERKKELALDFQPQIERER